VSPPGRPKGEYRSAQREGTPVSIAWAPQDPNWIISEGDATAKAASAGTRP